MGLKNKLGTFGDTLKSVNDEYYPKSIIETSTVTRRDKIHLTQKPVPLMEYLIRTYTNKGETVLDFTMGSGTTGVACVIQGRDFIGIEKDKKYFEIARRIINREIGRKGFFK